MNIGETFRCSSLTLDRIRDILSKEMPEYSVEIRSITLYVKKTYIHGVRIQVHGDLVYVSRKPPTIVGLLVDDLTFHFVSSCRNTVLSQKIITRLKKECG